MTDTPLRDFATVSVARTYPVPPARVFAALTTREAMQVWGSPADTFRTTVDPFDFREGGVAVWRMDPGEGDPWINEDRYQEIVPDARIILTSALRHQGALLFAGVVVMTLTPADGGTRLMLEEHGYFPDGRDQAAMHQAGWGQVLDQIGAFLKG